MKISLKISHNLSPLHDLEKFKFWILYSVLRGCNFTPPFATWFFCNVGMSCEKGSISLNATCSYQAGYKPGSMLNKVLYGQFPPRGPTLYSFMYHFSGRYAYRIPASIEMLPLVKKFTSLLPAVNSLSFNWIKTRTVFQLALLGLKQTQMYRFPYPFIYLVPGKRYFFRAELPPIGHYGKYPPGFETIHSNALLWMFILIMLSISPCWKSRWIIYCIFLNPKNNRQQFRF